MPENNESKPPQEVIRRVTSAFLIYEPDELLGPLTSLSLGDHIWTPLVEDAADGLRSVLNAGTLPFHLIYDAVWQRRFDAMHAAERIRSLKGTEPGEGLTEELEDSAFTRASERMRAFINSGEGWNFMRDTIIYEFDRSLRSPIIRTAAEELLVQTLVSTWAVCENFCRSFIVSWINSDPRRARPLLASPDLKEYFGRQVVDIEVIGEHGFDLTGSMGSILFRGRRLDHLGVIRSAMAALFDDSDVRNALGTDLWMLNQRRHLFIHKRGWVDEEYLQRTGDKVSLGQRLAITSEDVEHYLVAVQKAVRAIATVAKAKTEDQ